MTIKVEAPYYGQRPNHRKIIRYSRSAAECRISCETDRQCRRTRENSCRGLPVVTGCIDQITTNRCNRVCTTGDNTATCWRGAIDYDVSYKIDSGCIVNF